MAASKFTTTPSPIEVVEKVNAVIDDVAGKLSTTGTAAKATADASGNTITSTYATKTELTTGLNGKLSTSGTAAKATILETARTIRTNLGSTSTASFNGSANITPGVTGTLPIANGGTGATTAAAARSALGIDSLADDIKSQLSLATYSVDTTRKLVRLGYLTDEQYDDLIQLPIWATTLGTGADGDFSPTSNTTLQNKEYNFKSVNIPSGVTVTLTKNAVIRCLNSFTNSGTISGVGTGGAGGAAGVSGAIIGKDGEAGLFAGGTGGNSKVNSSGATSASRGGFGVRFENPDPYVISTLWGGGGGGGAYSTYNSPAAGGAGGNGGAGLCIVARSITNTGVINLSGADGAAAAYDWAGGQGGGGAGGSAFFVAISITNTGTFTSNGGKYNSYGYGSHHTNSGYPPTNGSNGTLYTVKASGGGWV